MARAGNQTRSLWWVACALVGGAAAAGVLVLLAVGPPSRLDTVDKLASVCGALLAAAALAVSVVAWQTGERRAPADPAVIAEDACDELARRVRQQWTREAQIRGLLRPEPLRIRWSSTGRPVAAPAADVVGHSAARVTKLKLHGDVLDVASAWRQLPAGQLVVIGAPGAGKTSLAVILVCELLKHRARGEPVPILLDLLSWDVNSVHLHAWLARRIAEQHAIRVGRDRLTADLVERLIDQRRIVPILDGLDELTEPARAAALSSIDDAVGADRPVVLTCRAREYQDLIASTGTPLARAAVVEIEPVTGMQASSYLQSGQIDGYRRWRPVIANLQTQPDGALAKALSTPLMVYLARTAYVSPRADPANLTDFAESEEIEAHLLDAYLPALYASPLREHLEQPRQRVYPTDRAASWLTFLACHLRQMHTADLAWWRLINAVPRHHLVVSLAVGLGVGLTIMLPVTLIVFPASGWSAVLGSIVVTLIAGVFVRQDSEEPHRMRLQLSNVPAALFLGVGAAAAAGTPMVIFSGLFIGIALGTAIGIAVVLVVGFAGPAQTVDLSDPRLALRNDRTALLLGSLVGGASVLLIAVIVFTLGVPFTLSSATVLCMALTWGVLLGILRGHGIAWAGFGLARWWLALRRRLPWRLMRFLEDAHRRGILRQVGAVYQFRHARLQDHLVGTAELSHAQSVVPRLRG